jgi:hypothetical protein
VVLEQRVEAVRPHDASDDQPLDLARPVRDPPAADFSAKSLDRLLAHAPAASINDAVGRVRGG